MGDAHLQYLTSAMIIARSQASLHPYGKYIILMILEEYVRLTLKRTRIKNTFRNSVTYEWEKKMANDE